MRAGIALFTALTMAAPAQAAPRQLTRAEMQSLAWAGVHSICPRIPRRAIDFDTYPRGRYLVFEALGSPPGGVGSVHPCMPFYVVDPATGDMWDGVSDCGVVTSPAIRRMQAQYRARIGLSAARYKHIRRLGPMCGQGQD